MPDLAHAAAADRGGALHIVVAARNSFRRPGFAVAGRALTLGYWSCRTFRRSFVGGQSAFAFNDYGDDTGDGAAQCRHDGSDDRAAEPKALAHPRGFFPGRRTLEADIGLQKAKAKIEVTHLRA